MAIVTQGTTSKVCGKPVEEGCKTHAEATVAARARAKIDGGGGRSSTALRQTVGVQLYYSFESAEWYVVEPPPEQATATALRTAMGEGADDEALAKVAARPATELAAEQVVWVQAAQLENEAVDLDGSRWEKGAWLIKPESGRAYIVSEEDFGESYREPTAEELEGHGETEDADRLRPDPPQPVKVQPEKRIPQRLTKPAPAGATMTEPPAKPAAKPASAEGGA